MNNAVRAALIALPTVAAMAGLGFAYKQCVEPNQPVWHPEAPVWDTVPVPVVYDPTEWGEHEHSIAAAVDAINARVDCHLLVSLGRRQPIGPHVRISHRDPEPCGFAKQPSKDSAATAYYCLDGDVEIHIGDAVVGSLWEFNLVTQHELGHALGLDHDPFSRSVMHSKVLEYADAPYPPRLTDKDAESIRERYCK